MILSEKENRALLDGVQLDEMGELSLPKLLLTGVFLSFRPLYHQEVTILVSSHVNQM